MIGLVSLRVDRGDVEGRGRRRIDYSESFAVAVLLAGQHIAVVSFADLAVVEASDGENSLG